MYIDILPSCRSERSDVRNGRSSSAMRAFSMRDTIQSHARAPRKERIRSVNGGPAGAIPWEKVRYGGNVFLPYRQEVGGHIIPSVRMRVVGYRPRRFRQRPGDAHEFV